MAAGASPCILIIEDDIFSLRLYVDLLRATSYTLLSATDGATGLAMAREHRPDLVLTDARLPELSGIDLCRALKSDERTQDIPILVLSAWPEYERLARAARCDRFLMKPVPISVLLAEIDGLIGRH